MSLFDRFLNFIIYLCNLLYINLLLIHHYILILFFVSFVWQMKKIIIIIIMIIITIFIFLFFCKSSGLRDDLNFLLERRKLYINLCSLHCKMWNRGQLLGSLGLFAYHIGSFDRLNEVLSNYSPENCRGFPYTIKKRKGQQTAIEKHSIKDQSHHSQVHIIIGLV